PPPDMKQPEIKEEKMPEPEPEPEPEAADEPPPGEDLGVDSDGAAGSDGFGLVGKKGGAGLLGGGGGNAFIFYGQHVQRELVNELQNSLKDKARNSRYTAVLHVWIAPNGDISKVELANSSGTSEIDEALHKAISQIRGRFKPPPERLPQPLKIRIKS
ncbi:MAG: TonB family protein, partial [Gammaproteobacteria bacterium]|nr:TonB family protein [Gammaproteobacteria bacterium]